MSNLALDCASSEFYNGNEYVLGGENKIFLLKSLQIT